jgi:hypothetical protein
MYISVFFFLKVFNISLSKLQTSELRRKDLIFVFSIARNSNMYIEMTVWIMNKTSHVKFMDRSLLHMNLHFTLDISE